MILKHFVSRNAIRALSISYGRVVASASSCSNLHLTDLSEARSIDVKWSSRRCLHTEKARQKSGLGLNSVGLRGAEEDTAMSEFLSRFMYLMRRELTRAYPGCDKESMEAMLVVIVAQVVKEVERGGGIEGMAGKMGAVPVTGGGDLSEDLWRTVWEMSERVLEDMRKEKKKEKMRMFLQCREVKELCRFAGEVGITGEMLREMRFKWAREKMEETLFHDSLWRMRREAKQIGGKADSVAPADNGPEEQVEVGLPKRRGGIRYKIYGLDLSDAKWAEVAERIHESGQAMLPEEPKEVSGKCKLTEQKILSLGEEDDFAHLLAEWKDLMEPARVDWIALLDRLKKRKQALFFKVAEFVLGEESFQTNIRDYSKLLDAYAKRSRIEDAERILEKMKERGLQPDVIINTILVHMYSKAGNFERVKESYESLRSQGLQPDLSIYTPMIMAHVNAGQPQLGETLLREMEMKDIKPSLKIYMGLLRSFAQLGQADGAHRIATAMQFGGFEPTLESCSLLVQAWVQAGQADKAKKCFDSLMNSGFTPDDECTASMLTAYEKSNCLDKALALLLQLEKKGFEPGIETYSVMVDWLGKCRLVKEAEQLLGKIAEIGETPPLKIQVGLCDMYSRAKVENKALAAMGVLVAKKDQLAPENFERVILGFIAGGFGKEAQRMLDLMKEQGFEPSQTLGAALLASQTLRSTQN